MRARTAVDCTPGVGCRSLRPLAGAAAEAATQLPAVATAVLRRSPPGNDVVSMVRQLGSRTYHPFHVITNNEEIEVLRRAEIEVNVWTVNHRAAMARFIDAGVTGIITDFPQTLSQSVAKRK